LNKGIYFDQGVLGETITIESKDYEIVGICESAVYYYKLMEPTQIGTGNIDAIYYLPKNHETITDIVMTIKDASLKNTFSKEYLKMIEPICKNLEDKQKLYIEKRIELLKKEAIEEGLIKAYDEARKKLILNGLPSDTIETYLKINKEAIEEPVYEKVNEEFSKLDGSWYVLNRKSNTSYVSFKDNSNKVNDVAVVFPFFFFFIAGLIALTSITRMVSEDRSSIGTLKSLGFSNSAIVKKYLFYALFACIIGVLIGVLSGVYVLPIVIYICYNSLFVMPAAHYLWNPIIILVSSLSMCLTIVIVMLLLCFKTLKERPNALMVPKAPKAGKRILLERIGLLWRHLTFRFKSALRNVFRFKRNLIMMIVGVGGCTALMLVAFGLKNSMNTFSKYQFDEILNYDLIISSEEDVNLSMLKDSTTLSFYQDK
ncbi:MAG: ABC transporter permease, partial [Anaeroplasmataceae bacterium]|nr:ABC transporter permease [Anaeroplasmataceae bacterium]